MAGIKITDLPAAPSAQLTDVFPVDQLPGPVTYKESNAQLLSLFQDNMVSTITGTANQIFVSAPIGDVVLSLPQDIAGTSNVRFNSVQLTSAGIKDVNSNTLLAFNTVPPVFGVNYWSMDGGSSGTGVKLKALGSDADVGMNIIPKGAGAITLTTGALTQPLSIFNGTSSQHATIFTMANTAAARAVTFQDASGTLAFLTDIPAGSPSALTRVNDTNVTVTLGGTPTTALLQAVSLTLGWTGTLAETRGGTNQSTYLTGDTLYASAANTLTKLTGNITTAKQYLSQTGSGAASAAPAWATIAGADITGAALTKTDDTNVTLTLGGTPTTALLRAASLTLGWTGQLSLTRGGSNASLTASNGGIVYSTASAMAILAGTATANQMLLSGASGAPAWSTATHPATTTINQILYSSAANVIAGLATANSSVLVTSSGGVPSLSTALPSGLTATNMNLTTPTLGAATATSINFGGTTLSTYAEGTWTPVFTFVTPGDLSVAYSAQLGIYTRIGRLITVTFYLACTPTYTTASGGANITGLPFTSGSTAGNLAIGVFTGVQNMTLPAGCTYAYLEIGTSSSTVNLNAGGSAIAQNTHITTANILTATTQVFQGTITYMV